MPDSGHRAGLQKRLHRSGDGGSLRHCRSMDVSQGSSSCERLARTVHPGIGTDAQGRIICPYIYRCNIHVGSPLQDSGGNGNAHNARVAEQGPRHAFLAAERLPDHRTRHHGILLDKQHVQHSKRRNFEPVGAFPAAETDGIHRLPISEGILLLEQLKH